ncbi:hypothetical protein CBL_20093 [Carabus blaptoides fortunei]
MFVCCDVETGFVLDIIVYTGSQTEIDNDSNIGMSGSVVKTIMQNYLEKGHRTGEKPKFSDFRLKLITQLIEKYHNSRPSPGGRKSKNTPERLTAQHSPHPVPQAMAQELKTQRKCYVLQQFRKSPKK